MPVTLIEVTIGNRLDNSTRSIILSCDSKDKDVINNLGAMIDMFIELDEWSGEKVTNVQRVKPINISSTNFFHAEVEKVFN